MSPRAEEQDSQIVAPNYDYGAFDDSDPQGIHDKTPEINAKATSGHLNSNALHQEFNSSHKSLRSVVEETQFMDLEIETQAGTTQDTQMLGDSPTLKRILQSNNAASPVTLPAKPDEGPSSFLVTRPVAMQNDSATREFKFGTPIKPIPGTYIRQTPKTGSSNSAPPARPEKSTDDELRPIKPTLNLPPNVTSSDHHDDRVVASDKCSDMDPESKSNNDAPTPPPSSKSAPQQMRGAEATLRGAVPTVHQLLPAQAERPNSYIEYTVVNQSHRQPSTAAEMSVRPVEEPCSRAEPPPRGNYHNYSTQSPPDNVLASPLMKAASADGHRQIGRRCGQNPAPERKPAPSMDASVSECLPQHGLDQDPNESRPPHRKNSKSRSRILIPFPDAVPTPDRRRKQGKHYHNSVQQTGSLKPPLSSAVFSRPPPQDVTSNTGYNKSNNSGQTENKRQRQRSASNVSMNSGRRNYHQPRGFSGAEPQPTDRFSDLHEKGNPEKRYSHQFLSCAGRDSSQLEHLKSNIEIEAQDHLKNIVQVIDRGRTRSRAIGSDQSVMKEPFPISKQFVNQEPSNFLAPTAPSVASLNQTPLMTKSSDELMNETNSNDGTRNLHSDIADDVSVRHEQEGMVAIEHPIESTFDHRVAPGPPSTAGDSFLVPWHTQSELQSRPPPRRSNLGNAISRPLSAKNLQPAGSIDCRTLQPVTSTRVNKSHSVVKQLGQQGPSQKSRLIPASELMLDYHKFVANGAQYIEILHDYERQGKLLETQKVEINLLKTSDQSTKQELMALQVEKLALDEKIKKLTDLSSKYKKHMNDVVKSQKFLKAQAVEFQKTAKEAVNTYKGTESLLQRIHVGIKEVKECRASVDGFATIKNKELAEQNARLLSKNKELRETLVKIDSEKKRLSLENIETVSEKEKLQDSQERLRKESNLYVSEIFQHLEYSEKLKEKIKTVERTNKLLQRDLDKCLLELGSEKNSVEKLQNIVDAQVAAHKGLLDLVKQTPAGVAEELVKDEGILAKIVTSMNSMQEKVDDAASLVSSLKAHRSEPPASLIKLIEDLFSRFEAKSQDSENAKMTDQESTKKLMEDLKDGLDQLRLDKETESRLNFRINELGQTNHNLATEKRTLEHDAHSLTEQLNEVKRDLVDCQGQLSSKSDELAVALAIVSKDPLLRTKIQILESTNSKLESRLESTNQDISELKEKIQALTETLNFKEKQIRELERNVYIAQMTIKNFNDEKSKYITDKEREKEEECYNITQKFEGQKTTMKRNFEDEMEKLNQKYKERVAELNSTQAELSRLCGAAINSDDTIKALNQKQMDMEAKLQSTRQEAQRVRETNGSLESTVKDLNRKQKERELELTSAKEEIRRAQEASIRTSDTVQTLEKKHNEVELEHKAAREEVTKLLEENKALGDTVKKHQAELAAFQESFAQQAVHLERLADHNPGRQVFEGVGGGLQLTRNELSDVRNQLRFIENNNAQNISASNRVQTALESRLLSIDVLQRERDAAENQVAILRKENEQQKQALASRAISAGQRSEIQIEKPTIGKTMTPLQADDRVLRVVPLATPEASLRQAIRRAGSGSILWQASVMQNQVTSSQGVHNTPSSSGIVDNPSKPLHQAVLAPRSLRPADRKSSNPKLVHEFQNRAFQPVAQRLTHQYQDLPMRNEDSMSVLKDPKNSQHSEVSWDANALMDESGSSLTDLGDIQDRLENFDKENKAQSESAHVRHGEDSGTRSTHVQSSKVVMKKSVQISRQVSKRSWFQPESESSDEVLAAKDVMTAGVTSSATVQPPAKKIKIATSIPPSIEEESRKRRTSMPTKSAMKKRVTTEAVPREDQHQADVAETSAPAPMVRSAPAHQDHGLAAFKGYVSGKSTRASLATSLNSDKPGLFPSKMPAHKPALTAPSPMHLPRRQGQAPASNQGRQRSILRMAPTLHLSERVIPDSQEA